VSTLVRITVVENISGLVDLQPGESEWHEQVITVQPGTAFSTPELLEDYAVACTLEAEIVAMYTAGDSVIRPPEPWMNMHVETYVMAHFSEDL
jgi:hypothetical protein